MNEKMDWMEQLPDGKVNIKTPAGNFTLKKLKAKEVFAIRKRFRRQDGSMDEENQALAMISESLIPPMGELQVGELDFDIFMYLQAAINKLYNLDIFLSE